MNKLLLYLVLTLTALTMLAPFFWTVATSLKDDQSIFSRPLVPFSLDEKFLATVAGYPCQVRVLRETAGISLIRVLVGPEELVGAAPRRIPSDGIRKETKWVFHFENYPEAWRKYPFVSFWRAYANTLVVALIVTLGQVVTSSLAAYAFARLRFPGRDTIFFAYLATMMIPGAVTMIPTFALLKQLPALLDWLAGTSGYFAGDFFLGGKRVGLDSYFALIVPRLFSAYGTFMLRQFFLSIPRELEEAARIDGCGSFRIFRTIVLPFSQPALATLTIFTFMWAWGDFMWPLLVTSSNEIKTLPLLLQSFQGQYDTSWNLMMAASVTAMLPLLVLFVIGQRYFIEGIKLGALKG